MPTHRARILLSVLFLTPTLQGGAQVPVQEEHYSYYDKSNAAVSRLAVVEKYHLGKGMDDMEARQWYLALAEWDFILRYFPNHPRILYLMSLTAEKLHDVKKAEDYFKTAMTLYPDTASTYSVYGIFLFRQGQVDEAIEAYSRSLSLDPSSPETHYNLGLAYAAAGREELANRHAQAAYSLGFPLPGLSEKLKRSGSWKPLPAEEIAALVTPAK